MLKHQRGIRSSPSPRPNASPGDTFWRGLAGRALEYIISALIICGIELENTSLILNKRTVQIRLPIE